MLRTLLYPTIDEIVFNVAVEYGNLYRGMKLDHKEVSPIKRAGIIGKTGIGYALKKNSEEYFIYLVVEPYILQVGEEYYFFEEIPLGRNFHLNRNLIAFTGAPKVLKRDHYNHPFVHSDNEICYYGNDRWSKDPLNIEFGHWYDTTERSTWFKIARWLAEGRNALQHGYFGMTTPFHPLDRNTFSSEYRSRDEALRSGVKIIETK